MARRTFHIEMDDFDDELSAENLKEVIMRGILDPRNNRNIKVTSDLLEIIRMWRKND